MSDFFDGPKTNVLELFDGKEETSKPTENLTMSQNSAINPEFNELRHPRPGGDQGRQDIKTKHPEFYEDTNGYTVHYKQLLF